jgi:hypothetical protein
MADVEHVFQAASCGYLDRSASCEALEFVKVKPGLPKGYARTDIIAPKDLQIVIAMFDRRHDRQSCAQIIDCFGRDAEAADAGNGGHHADVARAEKFKKVAARD